MQALPNPGYYLSSPSSKRASTRSANLRRGPSRVKKRSTTNPLSTTTSHRASTMSSPTERKDRKDAGLIRPLMPSTILPVDPLRMHPPGGLKSSISAPLHLLNPTVGHGDSSSQITKCDNSQPLTSEEINDKVRGVQLATQQLKGDPKPEPAPRSSRKIFSRIFKKLSISSKKVLTPKKAQVPTQSRLSTVHGEASSEAAYAQMNEARNLNSPEIQRVASTRIRRRPVARAYRFQHNATLRKLEGIDELDEPEESICGCDQSPFDAEGPDFEENLEDGVLKTRPDGASTPPMFLTNRYYGDDEVQPPQTPRNQTAGTGHDTVEGDTSAELDDADEMAEILLSSPTQAEKGTQTEETQATRDDTVLASGKVTEKKHPSPARNWLEVLDYCMAVPGAQGLDELAPNFEELSSLHEGDGRREEPAVPEVSSDLSSPVLNRESAAAKRAFFRPKDPRADEDDELA